MNEIYPLVMKPAGEPASDSAPPEYEELAGGGDGGSGGAAGRGVEAGGRKRGRGRADRNMNEACKLKVHV